MLGNQNLSPEVLMSLGGGILSGSNLAQGLGQGFQQASTVMGIQKQKAEERVAENKTRDFVQKAFPDIDASQLPPDMLRVYATEAVKQRFAPPAKSEFKTLPDGTYGAWDGQKFNVLGKSEKQADPTSIQRDLQAAGLQPGTPEYQRAILEHYKKSGMVVESTPEGGFRLVQGDVDTTKMPKLTEAEGKNAGFLKRALSAEKELSALEGEGTSLWNSLAGNVPVAGNYMVSADAQKFNQAKRNFINAVLRRESGAVITPSEFENAEQQYFPQPGDSAEVIAQKKKNRQDAIAGFEIGSGPAAERVKQMDQVAPSSVDSLVEKYRTK